MKKIAIIPARGGSKRIPRKNIKPFLGKPILAYSIEAALNSGLFDEVMVSTDDDQIAEIAKEYGASVPFLRSEKNSDDFTGPGDVVLETLNGYKNIEKEFDYACCIYATAVFVSSKRLIEGFELLNSKGFEVTFPVSEFNSPILRSFEMDGNCLVKRSFPEYEKHRSQDLPKSYFDAGQFYWFRPSEFYQLENKNVFGLKKGGLMLDSSEVQDIDTLNDWKMAEFKFDFFKNS